MLVKNHTVAMSRTHFRVEALDVPPAQAAHRMGLTLAQFNAALPDLQARGFPPADQTTGNFDLEAVDAWRRRRHDGKGPTLVAANAAVGFQERLARL